MLICRDHFKSRFIAQTNFQGIDNMNNTYPGYIAAVWVLEMEETSAKGGGCVHPENGLIGADLLGLPSNIMSFGFGKGILI